MVTVVMLLVVVAFALTVASAIGKCPLWMPVLLLTLVSLLQVLPLR